jgi:ribosome biogenesis SPOUT family RNA methylase Rps3
MHADKTILLDAQAENLRTENTNFNTIISKAILGCFMRHQTNRQDKILA